MPQHDTAAFPVLTTERLILREPRLADAADLLVFRGDYEVQKYNGPVISTLAEAEEDIAAALAEYAEQDGITWAVTLRDEGVMVGHFAFHKWSQNHRHAEIGYDLARAYWGRGLAVEALRPIIAYGFGPMNLHRIYSATIADNYPSVRLLEKMGFRREGTRREHSWEDDGRFHDSALFGLLRAEHQP